jgi:chlorophyllase
MRVREKATRAKTALRAGSGTSRRGIPSQTLLAALALAACGSSGPGATEIDASSDQGHAITPDGGGAGGDVLVEADGPQPADAPVDVGPVPDTSTADGPASGYGPYAVQGPDTFKVEGAKLSRPEGSSFTVSVYVPSSSGAHPVVVVSSGFYQPALAYASYAERLASFGVVAVLRDDPGLSESTSDLLADVEYEATTWLSTENSTGGTLSGKLDLSKIGLAGHSRGGQVSLLAAEGTAKGTVKALFGIDPVDGTSPPEAITSIGSIGIPMAFVGETTDGTGSNACAPAAQNYLALYGKASSPIVAITAVGADHTMFEDPAQCSFCSLCVKGTADQATVLGYSVRYLMAFFARELLGDASVGATFGGAGASLDEAAGLVTLMSK